MHETDKHSPRLDQQLKHEDASLTHGAGVEARSQDARAEQDTDGLPNPADRPDLPDVPGTGMTTDDVDERSKLAMGVASADWPADREALIRSAEGSYAGDDVVGQLRGLPGGKRFENVEARWGALGRAHEYPKPREVAWDTSGFRSYPPPVRGCQMAPATVRRTWA